jgi:hypothetical protein
MGLIVPGSPTTKPVPGLLESCPFGGIEAFREVLEFGKTDLVNIHRCGARVRVLTWNSLRKSMGSFKLGFHLGRDGVYLVYSLFYTSFEILFDPFYCFLHSTGFQICFFLNLLIHHV